MVPNLILLVVNAARDHVVPQENWVTPDKNPAHTMGFVNSWPVFLRIENDDAAPASLRIIAQRPCSQNELHDLVDTIQANEKREYGPFDRQHYTDLDGYVHFQLTGAFDINNVGVVAVRQI